MTNSLIHQPTQRKKATWLNAFIILVVILVCLGFASTITARSFWDGMFPSGEYHLQIQDENGVPLKGAILSVFEAGTKNHAFEYPIDNHVSEQDLVSNEKGVIVVLHKPRGIEFGGSCTYLFWIFPLCSGGSPEFDFQISAKSYKTIEFSTDDLFEPAYFDLSKGNVMVVLESGESVQIPVYELTFTLER